MNPNAKEFVFNPNASSWKPTFTVPSGPPTPPPTAPSTTSEKVQPKIVPTSTPIVLKRSDPVTLPSPAPAPALKPITLSSAPSPATAPAPVPAPAPIPFPAHVPSAAAVEGGDEGGDEEEEPLDENDPVWIATLKVAEGDREKALKMIEDPDALMLYPEIRAVIEAAGDGGGDEDWEAAAASVEPQDEVGLKPPAPGSAEALAAPSSARAEIADAEVKEEGEAEVVAEDDPREHLNLVFIGHVDAGKSTLSGSILYIMGKVDARTIANFEREAKQRNRESWFLAFIMDTSEEERAKGKTVEVGRAHFETDVNRYTILDAPGHKNYVPNMIAGCCQADVGVLVISARKGEFETGFEKGGQTREHALLAKTLGVQYLVVVVNKMDDHTVAWDVNRYKECVHKLRPYLKDCGYVIKKEVKFLPISGLNGDNILREVSEEKCPWWKAMHTAGEYNTSTPTLVSTLDALRLQGRNPDGPLRIPVLDRYLDKKCIVMGKVESGTLRRDDEIVIAPTKKRAKVEAIYIDETSLSVLSAKPGENVLIKFAINMDDCQKGYVLSTPQAICPAVTDIRVVLELVDMLEHRPIFSPGYDAVMHCHTIEIEVTCTDLLSVVINEKQVRRPFARQGQKCTARLRMGITTCMETFATLPAMGRFTLRDEGKTIATGKILELLN